MSQSAPQQQLARVSAWMQDGGAGPFPSASNSAPEKVRAAVPQVKPARPPAASAPSAQPVCVSVERESPQTRRVAPEPPQTSQQGSAADSLPLNEHAERTILGALILDGDRLSEISGRIEPQHFCLESHQQIFRAMLALDRAGRHVDAVTLPDQVAKMKGGVGAVGGHAYLASLTDGLPRQAHIEEYILILKEKARARELLSVTETTAARIAAHDPIDEIHSWALSRFKEIGTDGASGLRLLKGAEIVEQDQPAILPDHIFDETAMGIHGRPGDGKTTLAMLIAANLSVGRIPFTLAPCPPRNILAMTNEDSPARILNLYKAAGGDPDRLLVENCDDLWQLTDLRRLEDTISANAIGLVIVDGLASHSGKADLNSHQDTSKLLVPLRALAEKYHCLILVIHHLNKSVSADHIAKVAGSIGISASFRHNVHVAVDTENPDMRLMVNGKSNLAPPNVPALRFKLSPVGWAGEARISIDDVYRTAEPDEKPGNAAAWLREALADREWHDAGNLQQQATQGFNLSRRSIFRAADTLHVERRKAGFGGRAEWRLNITARETNREQEPESGRVAL